MLRKPLTTGCSIENCSGEEKRGEEEREKEFDRGREAVEIISGAYVPTRFSGGLKSTFGDKGRYSSSPFQVQRLMDRDTLADHLRYAYCVTVDLARPFVVQTLPEQVHFLLYPNQSYDGNPLTDDEETFPAESLPRDQYLGPLTEEEVLVWLWRDGKVPEWVNISVTAQDERFTYIALRCCGRFSAKEEKLSHWRDGHSPFHILGPARPRGWKNLKESSKFDLYWNGIKIIEPRRD